MGVFRKRFAWVWSLQLAILDLFALALCFLISLFVQGESIWSSSFTPLSALSIAIPCWFGLHVIGGYESRKSLGTLRYASEHAIAVIVILMMGFLTTYSFGAYNDAIKPGRSMVIESLILFGILSLLCRYRFSRSFMERAGKSPVYVIGSEMFFKQVSETCMSMSFAYPLKYVLASETKSLLSNLAAEGSLNREGLSCEAVILEMARTRADSDLERLILEVNLHAVPVYPIDTFVETYFRKVDCSQVSLEDALNGTFRPDHHSPYGNVKNIIDFSFSLMWVVLLLPLMLFFALVIRLQDGGPALFSQTRVGRFERPFLLYKFRTMSIPTGENNALYTSKNDSRVTRFGRLLRLTRLDELPQLWNVLLGDMSVIGPRAEWDKLVEVYKREIPFYNLRFMVKPGITGWAQVNYGYGGGLQDTVEKLQYDLYYIKNYSPEMDAGIVLKTLFVILSASGR